MLNLFQGQLEWYLLDLQFVWLGLALRPLVYGFNLLVNCLDLKIELPLLYLLVLKQLLLEYLLNLLLIVALT